MIYIIDSLLIILFGIIVFQDFKFRAISWYLLPLLTAILIYKSALVLSYVIILKYLMFNMGFLVIQFIGLTVYMSIRNKKIVNIIDSSIGLGDLLLLVVLCFAFSPANYIVFYIISSVFTLLGVMGYRLFSRKEIVEIPLAGAQSCLLIILVMYSFFFSPILFYSDDFVLSIIGI